MRLSPGVVCKRLRLFQSNMKSSIVESQRTTIAKIITEFGGKALAQLLNTGGHFFLAYPLVLLPLGLSLEALPGQRAPIEVHEHVAERFEIVSATLLYAHVRVDGRVARSAGQIFVLTVRDVLVSARIAEFFGQAKVAFFGQTHQKVVRLDVPMNEVLRVDVLNTADGLVREQKYCLQAEFARAKVEQVLETGPQQLHHHHVVVALASAPLQRRNAHSALQQPVYLALYVQLRVLGLGALELDAHLLIGHYVVAQIDVAE
ncbi:hypothetical protein BpHYR1_011981 [Brachionus plicatilis]|uniref:Uncharacterized protein n=1 Tax=Brachionus plicatilis TaxID=10195 RepID=A0A3M7S045_BRAPC|nr:hypothetical protein BpHYR1_011981 [Brachionus plicatilis]